MHVKRWLLLAPLLLTVVLLQSYFWVPTYEKQATGNPARLVTYIEGSSGDAKILNPILNADTASSGIVSLTFEGLLDLDENLDFRGRLATDWTISETAYLLVSPSNRLPDGAEVTGTSLADRIRAALQDEAFSALADNVRSIDLLPPMTRPTAVSVQTQDAEGNPTRGEVEVTFDVPERVAFSLRRVDQDFFQRLLPIIGDRYLENFPYEQYLTFREEVSPEIKAQVFAQLPELFPVAEHNPVIDFNVSAKASGFTTAMSSTPAT